MYEANSCVERLIQLTERSRWQRFCSIADVRRLFLYYFSKMLACSCSPHNVLHSPSYFQYQSRSSLSTLHTVTQLCMHSTILWVCLSLLLLLLHLAPSWRNQPSRTWRRKSWGQLLWMSSCFQRRRSEEDLYVCCCLSVCLPVYLSVCICVCMYIVCLSVCMHLCMYVVCLSVCMRLCMYVVCLSVCICVCMYVDCMFVHWLSFT